MQKWWMLHEKDLPKVDESEKEYIEDVTGRIPLLLRVLLRLGRQNFEDVKSEFLKSPELSKVPLQVEDHSLKMQSKLKSDERQWQL
jgi:hypothetical protein